MHLNHYENPYSRLAQHMNCAGANLVHCPGYADDLRPIHTLNKNPVATVANESQANFLICINFCLLPISLAFRQDPDCFSQKRDQAEFVAL